MRDRRNDLDCPLNVAIAKTRSIYGLGPKMSVMITRDPNHPVCRKCTRRDWWNCGIERAPTLKAKSTEKKEEKEKKEEAALEGLKTLFE